MTREDQIENQASEYANDPDNTIEWGDGWIDFDQVFDAFKNGAKWADAHPQFSREEFIEKACEWLWDEVYERVDGSEIKEALYEDSYRANLVAAFREYMEK